MEIVTTLCITLQLKYNQQLQNLNMNLRNQKTYHLQNLIIFTQLVKYITTGKQDNLVQHRIVINIRNLNKNYQFNDVQDNYIFLNRFIVENYNIAIGILVLCQNLKRIIFLIYKINKNTMNKSQDAKPSSGKKHEEYYLENDPFSLVLINQTDKIFDSLYKKGTYVWIEDDVNKLPLTHQQIQQKATVKIDFFKTVADVKQKYSDSHNIILICDKIFISDVENILEKMFKCQQIKSILIYGKDPLYNKKFKYQLDNNYFSSVNQAILSIEASWKFFSTGDFTNFISLDKQIWDLNNVMKTMYAMIYQNTDAKGIMNQFKQLAMKCFPDYEQDIQEFIQKYEKKDHLQNNQAVSWYSKQTFLFRLVNRLLRISRDPTSLFIIQPYFKDLCLNIYNLYIEKKRQLSKNKNFQKFSCFRGAQISQKQIIFFKSNEGSIILNLGYLSTSKLKNIANKFVFNALFQIEIDEENEIIKNTHFNYGYADLSSISEQQEQQILFNALNNFKIVKFQQISSKKYKIKLQFGQLDRILLTNDTKLTKKQLHYKSIGWSIFDQISNQENICGILIQPTQKLNGSEQYCKKILEIAEKSNNYQRLADGYGLNGLNADLNKDTRTMFLMYKAQIQWLSLLIKHNKGDERQLFIKRGIAFSNLGIAFFKAGIQIQQERLKNGIKQISQIQKEYYQSSILCYEEKQKVFKAIFGEDKQDNQSCKFFNNKGTSYSRLGQYQKALEYYLKCEKLTIKLFGETTIQLSITFMNIARLYDKLQQYEKALQYKLRCQDIQRRLLGQKHEKYAETIFILAKAEKNLNKLQEARYYYHKCLQIRRQTIGQQHPNYAQTLFFLALFYKQELKNYQKAIQYYLQSQKIYRKLYGQNHFFYPTILEDMAICFLNLGYTNKSFQVFQKCLKIVKSMKQNLPAYASILNNFGSFLYEFEQQKKAVEYYQKSVEIRRKIYKDKPLKYIKTLKYLGNIFKKFRQYNKALEYYFQIQKIQKQSHKQNDPQYASNISAIGQCFFQKGQFSNAIKYQNKCEKIKRQILGQQHPDYLITLYNLRLIYYVSCQFQKALEYAKKIDNQDLINKSLEQISYIDNHSKQRYRKRHQQKIKIQVIERKNYWLALGFAQKFIITSQKYENFYYQPLFQKTNIQYCKLLGFICKEVQNFYNLACQLEFQGYYQEAQSVYYHILRNYDRLWKKMTEIMTIIEQDLQMLQQKMKEEKNSLNFKPLLQNIFNDSENIMKEGHKIEKQQNQVQKKRISNYLDICKETVSAFSKRFFLKYGQFQMYNQVLEYIKQKNIKAALTQIQIIIEQQNNWELQQKSSNSWFKNCQIYLNNLFLIMLEIYNEEEETFAKRFKEKQEKLKQILKSETK